MKERDVEIALGAVSAIALARLLWSSFSIDTKERIRNRARIKNNGQLASELSGRFDEPLECAHIDHNKKSYWYDHPRNGRLLTLSEHLNDHLTRKGRNGLTYDENEYAISELTKRLEAFKNSRERK
jgi:hypothetical protein